MPLLLHHSDSAAFIQLIEFFIIGMACIVKKNHPFTAGDSVKFRKS